MESLAYGNKNQMIRFDVRITQSLVDNLVWDGYLEEDDFNYQEYLDDDWEEWGCPDSAKPLMNAIIDWYLDKVEEMDEKLEEPHCHDEWDEEWERSTDLDKIILLSKTGDNFHDFRRYGDVELVEIHDVDPNNPYKN